MQERFAVAYPIDLGFGDRKVIEWIIKERYPTLEALEAGYKKELKRYRKEPDEHDGPPEKVEILSGKKCRILQ